MQRRRSQSAMEYLMTYGWAILIIAVVLAVLYQIGVFSGGNFVPGSPAGACEVQRTTVGPSLVGECQGQLPKYASKFAATTNEALYMTNIKKPGVNFTISLWFYSQTTSDTLFDIYDGNNNGGIGGNQNFDYAAINTGCGSNCVAFGEYWNINPQTCAQGSMPQNKWVNIIVTVSNYNVITVYPNGGTPFTCNFGTSVSGSNALLNMVYPTASVGANPPGGLELATAGTQISNIQLYNITMSSSEANALYLEGIGGAPIRPQNLTGWWPLNGDLNDYSGFNQNGQFAGGAGGITFTNSWSDYYTAP